ncbi:MAG: T9SS type A sorting domain-containing protein [Candidatus Marinimicrobia bacterium]|nr:T9SS type A sorting domain-containing protein [Candidatus Neomarinimicrobiota bacterium]
MKHIVSFLFVISAVSATTINIPSDYTTIQEGLNASVDGDTVLVAQGTYSENLILANEIVLASHAIYDDPGSEWLDNDNINNTIVNGAHNGSCLIVRNGDIQPTIFGFTFQNGTGTNMAVTKCGVTKTDRSGGAILIYKAYPTINYNRFMDNGISGDTGQNTANGGAISHFADDDVEFDEDRNHSSDELTPVNFADFDAVRDFILESALDSDESNSSRDIPGELNIQNNYFEGNSSGDGENFYSFGYDGDIDVSYSVFEDIDCESNTVNEFVLRSIEDEANYVQNEISGVCIESNSFYVSANDGNDNNDGTETNPLKTIGHALTLVKDDGTVTTINLNSGVYSPSSNGEHFPIVLSDNIHLIGDESTTTVLDAEANANKEAATMIIKEVENVTVANLTLTGGYSEGHGCTGGGGLLLTADDMFNLFDGDGGTGVDAISTPLIENVIIENNHSHNGGGLSFFRTHGPVLNNVIIRNNTATAFGGGVFSYGGGITMNNVTVTGNQNMGEGQGGGMMLAGTEGTLDNMTITNNTAVGAHGGGIWTNNSGGPDSDGGWTMTNSTISGNASEMFAGGIMCAWSHPILINCTITGNTAWWGGGGIFGLEGGFTLKESIVSNNSSYGGGGGINVWGPISGNDGVVIEDCIVSGNQSDSDGGGIVLDTDVDAIVTRTSVVNNYASGNIGGIDVMNTNATINNVTVSRNTSGGGGGIGITNANVNLTNSIVWENTGNEIQGVAGGTVTYSDIEGGYGGEGNIDADPLFMDANNGDYTLQAPDSPCINAGIADLDGDGTEDITDYNGSAPDMGAFESSLPAPTGFQYYLQSASVMLWWDPSTDENFQYFLLERSTDDQFVENVVSNYLVGSYYTDEDLEFDTEYFYRVSYYSIEWSEYSETISVILEGLDISNGNNIPLSYKIHQNHPNPFNPVTTIRYDLPEDGLVNITIYDMMGRQINTLVNGQQTAGYNIVQWNATNTFGEAVSAGLYLYTIHAGNFTQTRKMVLLK